MQGLRLASVSGMLLLSACANEKFRDQLPPIQAPATESTESVDQQPAKKSEDASEPIPADMSESMPESQTSATPKPVFADCDANPNRPIVGDLYQLPPETEHLPDYKKLKALKKVCLAQLDIKTRNFSEGFPGVEKLFEWFSLDMTFAVKVPQAGQWEFKLIADDGAVLFINREKIIDNDGIHGTRERDGRSQLAAGIHDFRVSYFQGPRYRIALELYWKGPEVKNFSYIPAGNLLRPRLPRLMSELD